MTNFFLICFIVNETIRCSNTVIGWRSRPERATLDRPPEAVRTLRPGHQLPDGVDGRGETTCGAIPTPHKGHDGRVRRCAENRLGRGRVGVHGQDVVP